MTGHSPYYPTDVPASAGRPICYIQSGRGPGSHDVSAEYEAGVFYVPNGLSPATSSDVDFINAGGILIAEDLNMPAPRPLWSGNPPPWAGAPYTGDGPHSAVRTTVRGQTAYVGRTNKTLDRISVEWYEPDNTGESVKFRERQLECCCQESEIPGRALDS